MKGELPQKNKLLKPKIKNSVDGSYTVIEVESDVAGTLVMAITNNHFIVVYLSITVPRHDLT